MVPLRTGHNAQSFGIGLFGRRHDHAVTFRIDRNGFLQKAMHAFLSCILEMRRPEQRRRRDNHDIHTRVDHLLVSIESDETIFSGNLDIMFFFKLFTRIFDPVREDIAQCHDRNVVGGIEKILCGTGSATAAANKARFQGFTVHSLVGQFGNINRTGVPQRGIFTALIIGTGTQ